MISNKSIFLNTEVGKKISSELGLLFLSFIYLTYSNQVINIFSLFYTNWAVFFTAGHMAGHCDLYGLKLQKSRTTEACLNNPLRMFLKQMAAERIGPNCHCSNSTSAASTRVCTSSQRALVGLCLVPLPLGLDIRVHHQFVLIAAGNCCKSYNI